MDPAPIPKVDVQQASPPQKDMLHPSEKALPLLTDILLQCVILSPTQDFPQAESLSSIYTKKTSSSIASVT